MNNTRDARLIPAKVLFFLDRSATQTFGYIPDVWVCSRDEGARAESGNHGISRQPPVLYVCRWPKVFGTKNMTNNSPVNETEQIRFEEMARQSYKRVYNLAYRLTGSRPDAEDLTQETFCRAYRSFHQYDGVHPFQSWVLRIVTRLFLDLARTRRRRVHAVSYDAPLINGDWEIDDYFDTPDRAPDPEQKLMEGILSEEMQQALDQLTPQQRILVSLADIEGIPYNDIAEMIERPVGTVRSRLHRAHKQLRGALLKLRRDRQMAPNPSARRFELVS